MTESRPVARTADVAAGKTLRIERNGEGILLCNAGGSFYAIEDVCSHDGGELEQGELDGCRIECPRHGAYFDVTTGAALTFPAVTPIRTYPLRVENGDIILEA